MCDVLFQTSDLKYFNDWTFRALQLDLSCDVDGVKISDVSDWNNETSHGLQLQASRDQDHMQLQQRDREQLNRDKLQQQRDRDSEREHLHQLQYIGNLLVDPSPTANFQGYSHDSSCTQLNKNNNIDGKSFFT